MPNRRDHSRQLQAFAREMRREPTDAERALWSILRGKQLAGHRFRRQFPVAGYIVDFFCVEANLAVEADGGQHTDAVGKRRDAKRDATLAGRGVRVMRFSDSDVLKNRDEVAAAILAELENPTIQLDEPPPQPSPGVPAEGVRGSVARTKHDELVWALLSSDLAQEIKSEFNGRLAVGLDVAAATQHVLAHFHDVLHDPQQGPVVLVSLAALQLREHQLHTVIRDAALDLISTGEAAAAYPATTLDARTIQRKLLDQFAAALSAASVVDE
jgi:very-short-patch-repair endonuclease